MKKNSPWIIAAISVAAFSFIIRMPHSPQPVDVFFLLALFVIVTDSVAIKSLKILWPSLRPYCLILGGLLGLFLLGQIFNYLSNGLAINYFFSLNYGRFLFNSLIFFSIAVAVYCYPIIIRYISRSVLLSILVMLPVYLHGKYNENIFISVGSGGRLGGIIQESPIIFSLWMGVVFLVGIGLFLESKKRVGKIFLGLWLCIIANFILWSGTRASWVSLSIAVIVWCLFVIFEERGKGKAIQIIGVTIFAFLIGYGLLASHNQIAFQRTSNRITTMAQSPLENQIRTKIWVKTTPFYISQPFGLGLVLATPDAPLIDLGAGIIERFNHQSYNSYLEVLVCGGLGAFVLFIIFILQLGKDALRVFREKIIEIKDSEMAWLMAVIFIIFNILFTDAFFFRHVWFVFGVALGILLLKNNPKEKSLSA